MDYLQQPILAELNSARSILIAGAGGGFDIFSGLPLFFGLRSAERNAHLANLSFTQLEGVPGRWLTPAVLEVTPETANAPAYFPEFFLTQWFREQGESIPTYCFDRVGVQPLLAGYRALVQELAIDAVVLVDGGTDSLMRGDEGGLGTPEEDMCSIAAVDELDVPRKFLMCLGFGVDSFHGVCHAHALEAIAELTQQGAFLGVVSLLREMPEVQRYMAATLAVFEAMPHHPSIVSASILSALEGQYGDHHRTERTQGSKLWINPLMTLYWCFHLGPVARRVLYLDELKRTETYWDLMECIRAFRDRCAVKRDRTAIPDVSLNRKSYR